MASFLWKISPPRVAQASMYALVRSTGALRIISDRLRMSSFHLSSCVREYNVPRMAGLHRQEQFFSVNGKTEQQRSLRVAAQNAGLTVGHVPRTISCLCSVFARRSGSIVCTFTGASITRDGKSLAKTSTVLKVIFDRLLGHSAQ